MPSLVPRSTPVLGVLRRSVGALALIAAVATVGSRPAKAQTFTVLHDFTGGQDGGNPWSGLTMDAAGNLYGTASVGGDGQGTNGHGVVYKLTHRGSGWVLTTLYEFQGGSDGSAPAGGVIFRPDDALYGTTEFGGGRVCQQMGCGTVFRLSPPATTCHTTKCPWTETVLYRFQGQPDAWWPLSRLTFDSSGNLYGTTFQGGSTGYGAVYELAHSDGGWSESVFIALMETMAPRQRRKSPSTRREISTARRRVAGTPREWLTS